MGAVNFTMRIRHLQGKIMLMDGQDMCQSGFYFGFVEDLSLHDLFLYEFSCTIGLDIMQDRSVLDLKEREMNTV